MHFICPWRYGSPHLEMIVGLTLYAQAAITLAVWIRNGELL